MVFVGDGKGGDALKPFWKRPHGSEAKIEAVAMDMSAAYRGAVSAHLPKAQDILEKVGRARAILDKSTSG